MQSRWNDSEARRFVQELSSLPEALALRVYSSRLIGSEPALVLHGGGNTSLKTQAVDAFGESIDVIHVKGSGHDLATIDADGLPAVRLRGLVRLRELEALDDATMVAEMRRGVLDPSAPNPSLELLLHALLPGTYVDHSHADAILALTDQPDGESRVRALLGHRVGFVPYAMPGFELAKRAAEVFEKTPHAEGLVLEKHGLFTFGDTARESYERHIAIVERAEAHVRERLEGRRMLDARPVVAMREPGEVAPVLRGALAIPTDDADRPFQRVVIEHRTSSEIGHFAAADLAGMLCAAGPVTPTHATHTRGSYLWIERPPYADLGALGAALREQVEQFRQAYRAYFERHVARAAPGTQMKDPTPRVAILPGLGLFAAAETRAEARVIADIAEHSIRVKIWASSLGMYQGISESELFDVEYWPLERAKVSPTDDVLQGQVALVTGGAGAIGEGVARKLLEAGACVVLVDRDEERLVAVHERLDSDRCETWAADVTDEYCVRESFRFAAEQFGGIDIIVPNAGVAVTGALEQLDLEDFQRAADVNLTGTFLTLREALKMLRLQATGGNIVLISTKNVTAPGADFGAYSASKAGGHQLGRVAAVEAAAIGVRVNMINADAVFGDPDNPSGLWSSVGPERAAARGLDESELADFYRDRNLLKARVTADHVGNAVVFFASQQTPTTGASLPVDGGLPDAAPR